MRGHDLGLGRDGSRGSLITSLILLAWGFAASLPAQPPRLTPLRPPAVVRIATDYSASDVGFYIADARGYLREVGIEARFVNFPSSSEMLPMLASDSVQVGGGITSTALFNAVDRGLDIRFLADMGHNIPGNPFYTMVVGAGSREGLRGLGDLRGRKIGLASIGSVNEYLAERVLLEAGLRKGDAELVVIDSFGNLTVALGNGAVDVAMHLEPFITLGTRRGVLEQFLDFSRILPQGQLALMLGSPRFTADLNLSGRFMVAYLRGVRDAVDTFIHGKHDEEVYRILVRYTDLKDLQLWKEIAPPGVNPNGYFFKQDVKNQIRWYKANGYYKGNIDVDEVTDYRPVDFALRQLGRYDYPLEIPRD